MNCAKCGNALPESESPFCPFCGEQQGAASSAVNAPADQSATSSAGEQEELHPLTAKAMAGKPAPNAVDPAMSGTFPANAAGQAPSPFGAPPVQEKKKLPGWAIALIAGGIIVVLAICCCLAIVTLGVLDDLDESENNRDTSEIVIPPVGDADIDELIDELLDELELLGSSDSITLIQDYIDTNRSSLEQTSEPVLAAMGAGATVDFLAGEGEFIFVYTYSADYFLSGQELTNILEEVFDASETMYELLAWSLASEIGLSELTVTVRYYQGDSYLTSRSFDSW